MYTSSSEPKCTNFFDPASIEIRVIQVRHVNIFASPNLKSKALGSMANPEEWAIDSNEALQLTLFGPLASNPLNFHPDFTYPIFGEAETIYGYKGLAINLALTSWDLRGYLKVTWDRKIDASLGTEAEDVVETMKEFLPEGNTPLRSELTTDVFDDENDFQMYLANPSFTPPGELIDSYTLSSNTYSVYKSSLRDPQTVALVERLQLLVILFIEGGSYIDTSDDRWQICILYYTFQLLLTYRYEKKPTDEAPTIAGYATAYPYHFHQITKGSPRLNDNTFHETVFSSSSTVGPTHCRLRLSQFVILPPFQRAGHGGKFYDIIFKNARADPTVQEISIEDPSAAFEDLRDRRDLMCLESNDVFKEIKAPTSKQWVEETRKRYKMPPVFCYH
jgi:histone acetyltransferase 1